MALSTLGTLLGGFTFGHVRQLKRSCFDACGAPHPCRRSAPRRRGPNHVRAGVQEQGGGRLRVHQRLGAPPTPRNACRHRRSPPRRTVQGVLPTTQRGAKRFVAEVVVRLNRAAGGRDRRHALPLEVLPKHLLSTLQSFGAPYTMACWYAQRRSRAGGLIADKDWTGCRRRDHLRAKLGVVRRTRLGDPGRAAARVASLRLPRRLTGIAAKVDAFHRSASRTIDLEEIWYLATRTPIGPPESRRPPKRAVSLKCRSYRAGPGCDM
jgi:hypothetical protein